MLSTSGRTGPVKIRLYLGDNRNRIKQRMLKYWAFHVLPRKVLLPQCWLRLHARSGNIINGSAAGRCGRGMMASLQVPSW